LRIRRRFLIVTWEAGGGIPPALGLGRLLAAQGHDVRILAPGTLRARVEATGCAWRPFPTSAEFDPAAGRSADDQQAYIEETFFGRELPAALAAEVAAERPDALVVDALLATTVSAAQATGVPTAALVHTLRRFHASLERFGRWGLGPTNELRAELGLEPIGETAVTLFAELQLRCEIELVALPAQLDPRSALEDNTVYVGPIPEEDTPSEPLELRWPADDPAPLVVVGLSSNYMHQEQLLERILEALAALPVHVLATTGPELDPDEVRAPAGIELRRFVQHAAVMPRAALVVTHAGTGTLMAAFAAGVPCVCIPLGRDQPVNAAAVAELGVGFALPTDATVEQIRTAVEAALGNASLCDRAADMRDAIAAYGDGRVAVDALERLATT
jgi:MGT family glycosyltransferase